MNRGNLHSRPVAPARRGTMYVAVLSTSMLVVVIGLGGLIGARVLSRTMDNGAQAAAAQWYAEWAVEVARAIIDQDSNWRTSHSNGPWLTNVSIGDGAVGAFSRPNPMHSERGT